MLTRRAEACRKIFVKVPALRVDASAIPANVAAAIKAGKVDLDDPATTRA